METDARKSANNGQVHTRNSIDYYGPGSNFEQRFVPNHDDLAKRVTALREAVPNIKIVLVMGGYDIKHVGHDRYLERAKEAGDIVIVGVDSDEKIKKKKGPNRPVVAEDERLEQLCHLRHVDLVTLKNEDDPKWDLINVIRPDILIATQETYSPAEIQELEANHVGRVIVHEPQAETSTTARIRMLLLDFANHAYAALDRVIEVVEQTKTGLTELLDKKRSE